MEPLRGVSPIPSEFDDSDSSFSLSRRRKLCFADVAEIIPATSPLQSLYNTQDEDDSWKSRFWYQLKELNEFRDEARVLGRNMRNAQKAADAPQLTICSDENTRGLEQRSCFERQRRKYMTIKFILKSAPALNEQRLSEVSQKCNAWAAQLAQEEAERDYERAYGFHHIEDEDNSVIVSSTTTLPLFCSSPLRKRVSSDGQDLEEAARLVRARLG